MIVSSVDVKSMISAGLASVASCNYDLKSAINGKRTMNILCIGHGGGTLPLFLADKIKGAIIDIVEIDPDVISASKKAMAFPSFSAMTPSGERPHSKPDPMDEVLWEGIHERLLLYESDGEKFVIDSTQLYDMVFVVAYNGEDTDLLNDDGMCSSRDASAHGQVCQKGLHKDVILGTGSRGLAFNLLVPWVCNSSLVLSRGFRKSIGFMDRDMVLDTLVSNSLEVGSIPNLPFSSLEYIKRSLNLVI